MIMLNIDRGDMIEPSSVKTAESHITLLVNNRVNDNLELQAV